MDGTPRKFRFLTRPVLALLGLAVGLLAAEASLRIAGVGYRRGRVPQPGDFGPSTARTILCVGDSFTFGVGAPPGQCYPEQLQRLLDRRHGAGRWRVINDGYPGRDSAQMLQALERRLERVRPSVMIVLAGLNNDWNSLAREGLGEDAALLSRIDSTGS